MAPVSQLDGEGEGRETMIRKNDNQKQGYIFHSQEIDLSYKYCGCWSSPHLRERKGKQYPWLNPGYRIMREKKLLRERIQESLWMVNLSSKRSHGKGQRSVGAFWAMYHSALWESGRRGKTRGGPSFLMASDEDMHPKDLMTNSNRDSLSSGRWVGIQEGSKAPVQGTFIYNSRRGRILYANMFWIGQVMFTHLLREKCYREEGMSLVLACFHTSSQPSTPWLYLQHSPLRASLSEKFFPNSPLWLIPRKSKKR